MRVTKKSRYTFEVKVGGHGVDGLGALPFITPEEATQVAAALLEYAEAARLVRELAEGYGPVEWRGGWLDKFEGGVSVSTSSERSL